MIRAWEFFPDHLVQFWKCPVNMNCRQDLFFVLTPVEEFELGQVTLRISKLLNDKHLPAPCNSPKPPPYSPPDLPPKLLARCVGSPSI
jgi:hypothetical protein